MSLWQCPGCGFTARADQVEPDRRLCDQCLHDQTIRAAAALVPIAEELSRMMGEQPADEPAAVGALEGDESEPELERLRRLP